MSPLNRLPPLALLTAVACSLIGCPPPPTTELETTPVGVIVGEVFIEDPARVSVGDATVQLLGSSYALTTEAERSFAIPAVPVGEHVLMIEHAPSGRAARVPVTVSQAFQTVELDEDLTTLQRAAFVHGQVDLPGDVAPGGALAFMVGGAGNQVVFVGDNGAFTLGPLPAGSASIGVSADGYAPTLIDVELVEGDNDVEAAFALEPSSGTTTVAGQARMIDRATHDAIVVKLNNGQFITTTDTEGNYAFPDVPPGRYEVRAEQAGYAPAILGQVAVLDDGEVEGSYDLWLSPGQAASGGSGAAPSSAVSATIVASRSTADGLEEDVPITFSVNATHSAGEAIDAITWRVSQEGSAADPVCTTVDCTASTLSIPGLDVGTYTVEVTVAAGGAQGVATFPFDVVETRVSVEIVLPVVNHLVQPGETFSVEANVNARPGAALTTTWTNAACGEIGDVQVVGQTASMAAPADRSFVTVSVMAASGSGVDCAERVVLIAPPVAVAASVVPVAGATIASVDWDPTLLGMGLLYLEIEEGHPLDLVADVDPGFTVVWSTDTGLNVVGERFDLATLAVSDADGTAVTMTATGPAGQVVSREAQIVVSPLTFDVALIAPVASTTYLAEAGLPLAATITHGWQTSFPSVLWEDESGTPIANTLSATVSRPVGQGSAVVTVTDVAGNVRQVAVNTSVAALGFSVTLEAPSAGAVVTTTDAVTLRASVTHALVSAGDKDEGDFVTTYSVDNESQGALAWDTDIDLGTFAAGAHTVRVIVQELAPIRSRSAEATFTVNAPPQLALVRTAPLPDRVDLSAFQSVANLTYNVSGPVQPGTTQYRWYLDGTEFDATWFGYGADPTDAARASLSLPSYDPALAPWDSPRWATGLHLVELCVTNDGAQPRQVCGALEVQTWADTTVSSANILEGVVETWSGAVHVTSTRYIYGTLIIEPGTRLFMADGAGIVIAGGTLLMGQLGAERVQVGGLNAQPGLRGVIGGTNGCLYLGIDAMRPDDVPVAVVESTTFTGCTIGVNGNAQYFHPDTTYAFRDVVFETLNVGVNGYCPTVMSDVTFRDAGDGIVEGVAYQALCADGRVYEDLVFEGIDGTAIAVTPGYGDVTVRNVQIVDAGLGFGSSGDVVSSPNDGVIVFEDSVVESGGDGVASTDFHYADITVRGNLFRDLDRGVIVRGTAGVTLDEGNLRLVGNRLENVDLAIELLNNRGNGTFEMHGNSFVGYDGLVEATSGQQNLSRWVDYDFRGNYLGELDDPTQAGFEQVIGEVGRALPSSFVTDSWDMPNMDMIVRLHNPLDTAFAAEGPPLAWVSSPEQSYRYHKDVCVPLEASAVVDGFDAAAGCVFELLDAVDPDGGPRIALSADADGCVTDPEVLADGENWLEMTCQDEVRSTTHRVRFYAARDRLSGPFTRAVTTITSDLTVSADLSIPAGHSVDVAPGVEILVSGVDERRGRRAVLGTSNVLGDIQRVDIEVFGALHFAGTQVEPIVVRPADGLTGAETWGDVIADGPTASLIYDHTQVDGATSVLSAAGGTPTARPTLEARFLSVTDTTLVGQRLCPNVFDDVTVDNVVGILRYGRSGFDGALCTGPLSIARLTATGLVGHAIIVEPHPDDPPSSMTLTDSVVSFGSDRQHHLLMPGDGMDVLVDTLDADRFNNLVHVADDGSLAGTVTIRDSTLNDFVDVYDENNNFWGMSLLLQRNIITGGERVVRNGDGDTTVQDNRITDVQFPFLIKLVRSDTTFTVTGNEIVGADVLATAENNQLGVAIVTGNNFFNATTAVTAGNGVNADLDFTNNHWGVATAPEVEALINDTRTDVDPGDDIVGQTDYAGWSATPLTLPDLP